MPEHCIETFAVADSSVLRLPPAQRQTVVAGITKHADRFAPGSLTSQAPITLAEEAAVLLAFFVLMGGPLLLLICGAYLLLLGSWTGCAIHLLVTLGLMYHPMPEVADAMRESWFVLSVYRYFSYRFVWSGDDDQASLASAAWIGAGPPHGVLPLANIISVSAINSFLGRHFVGAPASVVFRTPFLRYLTLLGCVDVAAKSIARATGAGVCVGMVPDGIAGIFRSCGEEDEVVYLKERKGLAKHALRTGTPILPAYSIGNTAVYGAWFDRWGVMEALSRRAQAWGQGPPELYSYTALYSAVEYTATHRFTLYTLYNTALGAGGALPLLGPLLPATAAARQHHHALRLAAARRQGRAAVAGAGGRAARAAAPRHRHPLRPAQARARLGPQDDALRVVPCLVFQPAQEKSAKIGSSPVFSPGAETPSDSSLVLRADGTQG